MSHLFAPSGVSPLAADGPKPELVLADESNPEFIDRMFSPLRVAR